MNLIINTIITDKTIETIFSPMNFMHCERGIGRPKKRRFGAPSILKSKRNIVEDTNTNKDEGETKKKGRTKGIKEQKER